MSENKTNFIIAVRGYKRVEKQKNANFIDITAFDNLNNKVLLRIIEPSSEEYIGLSDVKSAAGFAKRESYASAILISKKFIDAAVNEMSKLNIQHVSDDYMPPFHVEDLYSAIVDCVNNQCLKKCRKTASTTWDCTEEKFYLCKINALAGSARSHFENGMVGLLKNDLKTALALNK